MRYIGSAILVVAGVQTTMVMWHYSEIIPYTLLCAMSFGVTVVRMLKTGTIW